MSRSHTRSAPSRSQLKSVLARQSRSAQRDVIYQLQQSLGNAATARLLREAGITRGLGGTEDEIPAVAESAGAPAEGTAPAEGAAPTEEEEGEGRVAEAQASALQHKDEEARLGLERGDDEERLMSLFRDDTLQADGDGGAAEAAGGAGTATLTYPDIEAIKAAGSVTTEIEADWTSSESDYNERAAWVMYDTSTRAFSVQGRAVGTWESCTPTPKPADGGGKVHVGHYHIHPPLPPAQQPRTALFPIGPSTQDTTFANNNNSPGFVKDFNSTARKSGDTSYYNYGPTVRS